MKSLKKVLIIIIVILIVGLISGVLVLARNQKEKFVEVSNQEPEIINETENGRKAEEITVVIEEQENVVEDQLENNNETIGSEITKENSIKNEGIINQDNANETLTIKTNTSKNSNQLKSNNQSIPNNTQQQTSATPIQETEQVEVKKEEPKPVVTTPVRTYKKNTTYISKLRNTITTTVNNNISSLNKYGITSVEQFTITEDSSICVCYGGSRNGWTYENTVAYNTFVSSILKGTSMKIYAVDEYQNGKYIQTLCYYGH